MTNKIVELLENRKTKFGLNEDFRPQYLRISNSNEMRLFKEIIEKTPGLSIHDEILDQLKELIKSLNPTISFSDIDHSEYILKHLNGCPVHEYGVWVYYPWSKRLVHILDESEFIFLRTNRNTYKITPQERDLLAKKRIGIVGLSVGQSVAITIAMERCCGELRLADFDSLELTNLNRIRTPLHNLGLNKAITVAREIAEIDPYLKVIVFNEGINPSNIDEFILNDTKLDLVVDECDSLDIKILLRTVSRANEIPVLMDTSDRGMVDIERFDIEPERSILHGLIPDDIDIRAIENMSNEEKMTLIYKIVDRNNITDRLKYSLNEIGKTISTWPQLASSVTIGGGVITDIVRRIFLKTHVVSGRYYVDIEQII